MVGGPASNGAHWDTVPVFSSVGLFAVALVLNMPCYCSLILHHLTTLQFLTSTSTRKVITVATDAKTWNNYVLSQNV